MRLITIAVLAATLPLQATLVVSDGSLVIHDHSLVNIGGSVIKNGATVKIGDTSDLVADSLTIDSGGQLVGCGTIFAEVINNGDIVANCGSTMTLLDNVTNNSFIRAVNDTALKADAGIFLNNGTLDLITGNGAAPANLSGSGIFFSATQLPAVLIAVNSLQDTADISIQTNTYHSYDLETNPDLSPNNWTVEDSIKGDGSLLTWTVNLTDSKLFFRINITD